MNSAVFLDRDGVLIENRAAYVRSWSDVTFLPGSIKALQLLSSTPHQVIVVTNQSVVGRGIIPIEQAEEINLRILAEVERRDGRIDDVYMCPHAPTDGCNCRKPAPELVFRAAEDYSIDLTRSLLIGDAITDLQAGWAAGMSRVGLVKTGRGRAQLGKRGPDMRAFPVFSDLLEAVTLMMPFPDNVDELRFGNDLA